jgi:diacylglycerol kinase (ATP)
MARSVVLLVNPAAGGGRGKKRAASLAPLLEAAGADVSVRVASSAAETASLAAGAVAEGVDVLGVVGGDGTVNLVLPALRGAATALAIVPTGTGDDNARTFGHAIKADAELATLIATGEIRQVDLGIAATALVDAATGRVDDNGTGPERPFLSVICAGFDSAVNARANELTWPGGQARYLRALLSTLYNFKPITYRITEDGGEPYELRGMLMAIGNGRTYGGGMQVCPVADPEDGLLDVTILTEMSKGAFLKAFPKVYSGTFTEHPAVRMLKVHRIEVAGDAVAFADGEPFGPLPATVTVEPGALRVVSPLTS